MVFILDTYGYFLDFTSSMISIYFLVFFLSTVSFIISFLIVLKLFS